MSLDISKEEYEEILEQIKDEDSPVGIDAGKTHVLILQKLMRLERRLEALEMRFFEEEEE
ncbi:hypothetical protein [Fodinibius sp. Rm-B-1B1-1]|uniref:hypothetical protein n=1 Tax=Fodinibius alkaliphilus TaxID=3140241 RepID=UPI00315A64A8